MRPRWKTLVSLALAAMMAGAAWGAFGPARAQAEGLGRFAASMPSGALVYLEARDMAGLLKAWLASPTRARYFESASYRSFRRSRLYLKLQDRLGDLRNGFGVDVTDERLAEVVGGPTAMAIYDPGKLEVLLVSEVAADRALASSLFAGAANFERRATAKGVPYYAREVVTDGGSLVQRIAFGHANGRLWIGTSEALVAAAIDGPQDGGLAVPIGESVKAAGDFEGHDMMVWFDLDRTLRNKYFNLYWIHRNAKELEGLASGLLDLEFAADGVRERRWFVRREAVAAPSGADAAGLERLGRLAPDETQLVEAKAADATVARAVSAAVFGPDRSGTALVRASASSPTSPFDSSDSSDSSSSRPASGRYQVLDDRFDRDVDDLALAPAGAAATPSPAAAPFAERLGALVAAAAPQRYATYGAVGLPEGRLFASFQRAVVVELGAPDRFDAAGFERLVQEEFGRRFLVGGDATRVAWADASGARAIAGALVEQGGAYRLVGPYLVVAREPATCAAIAARVAGVQKEAGAVPRGSVVRLAEVRVAAAAGPFVRLTRLLDAKQSGGIGEEVSDGGEEDSNRPVLFFSENLASLLDVARDLETVRVVTALDGAVVRETVEYRWKPSAAPVAAAEPDTHGARRRSRWRARAGRARRAWPTRGRRQPSRRRAPRSPCR